MGQKVNPHGARVGVILDWSTKWYAGKKDFSNNLIEDYKLRKMLKEKLNIAGVSHIDIERAGTKLTVSVFTAKPGIVIGKKGASVDILRKELETVTGKKVRLNIEEIRQPELDAYLVAESIAEQLSKRVAYRRAMKQAASRALRLGAKGVKIRCSGRLAGAEMARSIVEMRGRVPLQTIRADVDYAMIHAHTIYGRIGVKVWLYKGDVLPERAAPVVETNEPA